MLKYLSDLTKYISSQMHVLFFWALTLNWTCSCVNEVERMGNISSYLIFASLPLYAFYVHIYRSHQLLKSNAVFDFQRIPSFGYLLVKYFVEALRKKQGRLHACDFKAEVAFTIVNCRFAKSSFTVDHDRCPT